MSLDRLEAEVRRRRQILGRLEARRRGLVAELERIDREMAGSGGVGGVNAANAAAGPGNRATGGRGKRPKNKLNLVEALGKVLKRETLSVTDAATAVQRIGYRTTSPNFRTIVNQALLANRRVFKKMGRGQYTARA